jgi:hypothetical protein
MALIFVLGGQLDCYSSQSTISARFAVAAPMTVSAAPQYTISLPFSTTAPQEKTTLGIAPFFS